MCAVLGQDPVPWPLVSPCLRCRPNTGTEGLTTLVLCTAGCADGAGGWGGVSRIEPAAQGQETPPQPLDPLELNTPAPTQSQCQVSPLAVGGGGLANPEQHWGSFQTPYSRDS